MFLIVLVFVLLFNVLGLDAFCYGVACDKNGPFIPRYGWKALIPGSGFWFLYFANKNRG